MDSGSEFIKTGPAFLGPRGENSEYLKSLLSHIIDQHKSHRANRFQDPAVGRPSSINLNEDGLFQELGKLLGLLKHEPPFFHPRYLAHMLNEPSIAAIVGYFTFMLSNPNNTTYEAGPVTTELELLVEKQFLKLFNWNDGWGHLTSGGTVANLETLWIGREGKTNGTVLFSEASHFGWKRLCHVANAPAREIPVDSKFRIDLNRLEDAIKKEPCSFVSVNVGSTGPGSVDDVEAIYALKQKYGFHLHADATYGGFFKALLHDETGAVVESPELPPYVRRQLLAMELCDSVSIDPHKHGLVSYGTGAIFYRDPKLKDIPLHDSPYTYQMKERPNIGRYSLEGSRAGAAAASCYLTYKMFPLHRLGIGSQLSGCLHSAQRLAGLIDRTAGFETLGPPDLDIVCFSNVVEGLDRTALNALNQKVLDAFSVMNPESQFFLSKFNVGAETANKICGEDVAGGPLTALRCVLMKDLSDESAFEILREFVQALTTLRPESESVERKTLSTRR